MLEKSSKFENNPLFLKNGIFPLILRNIKIFSVINTIILDSEYAVI